MKCSIATEEGPAFQIDFLSQPPAGVFGVVDAAGKATPLRIEAYAASIIHSYWFERTNGFSIHWDDRLVAVVDLELGGRVALQPDLPPGTRDVVAAVIVSLTLCADRQRAPAMMSNSYTAW